MTKDAYSVVDLPTFSLSWRNLICSLVVWGFFHPLHTQGRLAELLNWFVKGHQYSLEPLGERIFASTSNVDSWTLDFAS